MSTTLRISVVLCLLVAGSCKETPTGGSSDPVPTTIALSVSAVSLDAFGQTQQITATVRDQDGITMTGVAIAWASSDASIASVAAGLVTAVDNGTASVTVTAGSLSTAVTVTVAQAPESVDVSTTTVVFTGIGEETSVSWDVRDSGGSSIANAAASWAVSDPAVVSVSSQGVITAVGAGNAIVTVTVGSVTADVAVTVTLLALGEIIFTSERDGDYEIYVMNADGTGQTNLTNAPASTDWLGEAEPGGGRVVLFTTDRDGLRQVYSLDRDALGDPSVNLTNSAEDDAGASWARDASKIAFVRNDSIWVMDPDGSNQAPLGVRGSSPAWSPDGTQIAYTSGNLLLVMNADGSGSADISPVTSWSVRGPAWSPDGLRIAFWTRFGNGSGDLYAIDASDGGNLLALTRQSSGGSWPTYAPDGRIFFAMGPTTPNVEIWVADPDGSNAVTVTNIPGLDTYPEWVR